MNAKPFIFGAAAIMLLRFGTKGYAASRLNYFIDKISFKVDGATLLLFINIGVQNASGASITVRSFTGNLFVNDREVSNISSFNLTTIKPNTQTMFVITARISMIGAGLELWSIIQGGLQAEMKLQGTINVEGVPIPVTLTRKLI